MDKTKSIIALKKLILIKDFDIPGITLKCKSPFGPIKWSLLKHTYYQAET